MLVRQPWRRRQVCLDLSFVLRGVRELCVFARKRRRSNAWFSFWCVAAAFKSREDHRKQLELEEARKAGLAPAELDEDGKEINPHIPQYMSSAPWYLNAERPVSVDCTIPLPFRVWRARTSLFPIRLN